MTPGDGRQWFTEQFNVSRETLSMLDEYETELRKWNRKINLVSDRSLGEIWTRHFADSAQLHALAPPDPVRWLDLGSGAGFPGLVVAVLRSSLAAGTKFIFMESDVRKAAFLNTLSRKLGLRCTVIADRIENLPGQSADVVSARALAPLIVLLSYAEKHRRPRGICLFPKGATVHNEIADAGVEWKFDHCIHPSITDPNAAVIEIGAMTRV